MTLIASISNFSYPVIIGDLLTSSSEFNKDFKLPTFLQGIEKYLPENSSSYPTKLIQKTYIIKNNLVVAIAGNYLKNKYFIESITNFFKEKECKESSLVEFINEYDESEFIDTAYLFLFYEKKQQGFLMNFMTTGDYWNTHKSNLFGDIYAAGSGSSDFITESKRYNNLIGFGEINSENRAMSASLSLISGLLATESFSLETIKKHWGAGFELISFNEKKQSFYKMNELTYIIWKGRINNKTKDIDLQPFLVLGYKYFENILQINSYNNNKYERFGVLPINLNKDDVDINIFPEKVEFYNNLILNTFIIDLPNGETTTPSVICSKGNSNIGAVFINMKDDGQLEVGISKTVTTELLRQINEQNNA
jgi:hypothetical protein